MGSLLLCLALALLMGWLRLSVFKNIVLPVGYGVPIVIAAWTRSRKLLWALVAIFSVLNLFKFLYLLPSADPAHLLQYETECIAVLADLFVVSFVVDRLMVNQDKVEARTLELGHRNEELSQRREEIARQNEELQSQTEELERQTEELRIANEEMASQRETLEILLDLSRSLASVMTRDDVFTQVCQAVQRLVPPTRAAAILLRRGDSMEIVCDYGFGEGGPSTKKILHRESFASLVMEHGRTGYLEDIALRPDLRIPQPTQDKPFTSVLSAPLKIHNEIVGTLEVYSVLRRRWDDQDVALVESLAAQASVSAGASELFEQVENERRRLETVLQTVPFGILITNADGTQGRFNPAGQDMLQVPAEMGGDRVGWSTVSEILRDGRVLAPHEWPLARALQGNATAVEELELKFHDGRTLTLLGSAAPVRDRSGAITSGIVAFVEITELKKLQQELERRRQDAEEASIRKSKFLAAVSHDIRTPANAISLLAELIQRSVDDPNSSSEIPELAVEVQKSSLSLVHLVSEVLDLTRLDTGRVELKEIEFDLNEWLSEECQRLLPLAEKKNLRFECHLQEPSVRVRCDRVKLSRIVTNLLGNAIKFTDNGQVHVSSRTGSDGSLNLTVQDSGVGIAPEHLERVFDEFFQLRNPERDQSKGSGLGLSISKRLAEAMGGELRVESALGNGSTFTLVLPASSVIG